MKNYKIILALLLLTIISSCSTMEYPSDTTSIKPEASQNRWWKWRSEKPVDSRPFAYKGIIFAYSEKGILYAMDGISGNELWSFDFDNEDHSFNDPLFYEDTVFILLSSGTCFALDIYDGSVLWKLEQNDIPEEDVPNYVEYHGEREIKAKKLQEYKSVKIPTDSTFLYGNIHDDTLFFCFSAKLIEIDSSGEPNFKIKDYITAINPGNGDILWEFMFPSKGLMSKNKDYFNKLFSTSHDNLLYVLIDPITKNSSLYSFNIKTGELIWKTAFSDPKHWLSLIVNEKYNKIFFISEDFLYALDTKTGNTLWKWKLMSLDQAIHFFGPRPELYRTFSIHDTWVYKILFPSKNHNIVILAASSLEVCQGLPYKYHLDSPHYLIAFDINTGKPLWIEDAFSSILILKHENNDKIFLIYPDDDLRLIQKPNSFSIHSLSFLTGELIDKFQINNIYQLFQSDFYFYKIHGNHLLARSRKLHLNESSKLFSINLLTKELEWIIVDSSLDVFEMNKGDIIFSNKMIYLYGNGYIYAIQSRKTI